MQAHTHSPLSLQALINYHPLVIMCLARSASSPCKCLEHQSIHSSLIDRQNIENLPLFLPSTLKVDLFFNNSNGQSLTGLLHQSMDTHTLDIILLVGPEVDNNKRCNKLADIRRDNLDATSHKRVTVSRKGSAITITMLASIPPPLLL